MGKVVLQGFILVADDDLKRVEQELDTHTKLMLQEAGCITFRVINSSENPSRFDVYEEFTDRAAFELHQWRVKASRWGEVTVNVERHYQISEAN
ncbi:putative quinol monooxygenase [Vibrio sp. SCSIO 43137]|uniref:putative quinol monooxygenase n=1 Tax=Vibrio sp. SCSIO 43137 TaxID=3021011 RepID=UPI0023075E91|nr:antibiotic biosynthesis monooxygenase [Vibrio sp. SCSIO 43137]WCE31803.1 antibiotic biosynthesis monooxygenase [Vibrio sp. SCSIO 43137]